MRKGIEDPFYQFLWFYLLQKIRYHLVDEVGNNVSILIFPVYPELKFDILAHRKRSLLDLNFLRCDHGWFWKFLFWAGVMLSHLYLLRSWFSLIFKGHLSWSKEWFCSGLKRWVDIGVSREIWGHLDVVNVLSWDLVKVSAVIGDFDERIEVIVVHLNKSMFTIVFLELC